MKSATVQTLELDGGRQISEWKKANPARFVEKIDKSDIMTVIDQVLVEPEGERRLFGVQHFFYTPDGYPLFLFARVYPAVDPTHALHQYLYKEAPERQYGRGEAHVHAKLYDINFVYEPQEIRVFPLWNGTDTFI